VNYRLLPHIRGNVGLVFTKNDLIEIRDMLLANKVHCFGQFPKMLWLFQQVFIFNYIGCSTCLWRHTYLCFKGWSTCPSWRHCSSGRHHSSSEHWSRARKDLFLPSLGHSDQDFQRNYWNHRKNLLFLWHLRHLLNCWARSHRAQYSLRWQIKVKWFTKPHRTARVSGVEVHCATFECADQQSTSRHWAKIGPDCVSERRFNMLCFYDRCRVCKIFVGGFKPWVLFGRRPKWFWNDREIRSFWSECPKVSINEHCYSEFRYNCLKGCGDRSQILASSSRHLNHYNSRSGSSTIWWKLNGKLQNPLGHKLVLVEPEPKFQAPARPKSSWLQFQPSSRVAPQPCPSP